MRARSGMRVEAIPSPSPPVVVGRAGREDMRKEERALSSHWLQHSWKQALYLTWAKEWSDSNNEGTGEPSSRMSEEES